MKEKVYVDRLFADYKETDSLRDFKEEITVNLQERVKEFISKGISEEEAFEKAIAELGDITAIADDIAKQKRNEAIGEMYMYSKEPISKKTAAGFAVATGFILLSVGTLLFSLFGSGDNSFYYAAIGFLALSILIYVFFGLSIETLSYYPMKKGRAFVYGVVVSIGTLGISLMLFSFISKGLNMDASVIVAVSLIIAFICGLVFLLATETKRQKPWLKAMVDMSIENSINPGHWESNVDPVAASRFGAFSGGLWLLAIAIFITVGVFVGWNVSWLPILFALPIQVFMVAGIFKK